MVVRTAVQKPGMAEIDVEEVLSKLELYEKISLLSGELTRDITLG